jgi:hypothetical protein
MCSWNHSWKIWQNSRMKGCVYGTSISRSISHCMQSYSFASMMLPGSLHYQGRLKGRVVHIHGTTSVYLSSSKKLVYMRHRRFLPRKHKYRKMKMHFDNTVKIDSALKQYTRKLVFEMVKNIEVVFQKGTIKGQKRKKTPTLTDITFKK